MKKSFKHSVCKAITTFACASFFVAGMIGLNSISAKAESKTWSIDLSEGKKIVYNYDDLTNVEDESQIPRCVQDAFALQCVMVVYDQDYVTTKYKNSQVASVLSNNPYQGIHLVRKKRIDQTYSALDGSVGVGKYIFSKNTIMNNRTFSESDAEEILLLLDVYIGGATPEELRSANYNTDNLIFEIEVKYSDTPIITKNIANGTPSVSFEAGREFEDNGIKYRILDAAGNLSATQLTAKAKNVIVPDAVSYVGFNLNVTDIAQNFMKGDKNAKKVTIGSNVTSIGKNAFYKSKKLKKVTVKSTKIASIGKKAFGKNAKGFTLKMPKSCKKAYKKLLKKAKIKL